MKQYLVFVHTGWVEMMPSRFLVEDGTHQMVIEKKDIFYYGRRLWCVL